MKKDLFYLGTSWLLSFQIDIASLCNREALRALSCVVASHDMSPELDNEFSDTRASSLPRSVWPVIYHTGYAVLHAFGTTAGQVESVIDKVQQHVPGQTILNGSRRVAGLSTFGTEPESSALWYGQTDPLFLEPMQSSPKS